MSKFIKLSDYNKQKVKKENKMRNMQNINYFDYMYSVHGYTSYNDIIRKNIDGTIEEAIDIDDFVLSYGKYKEENKNCCCVEAEESRQIWEEVTDNTPYISDDLYESNNEHCKTYIDYYDLHSKVIAYAFSNGFKDFRKNISDINNWNDTLLTHYMFVENLFDHISQVGYHDNREDIFKYVDEQFDDIIDLCDKEVFNRYVSDRKFNNLPSSFFKYLMDNYVDEPFDFKNMGSSLNDSIKLLKTMFKTSPTMAIKICKEHSIDYKYFLKHNI